MNAVLTSVNCLEIGYNYNWTRIVEKVRSNYTKATDKSLNTDVYCERIIGKRDYDSKIH